MRSMLAHGYLLRRIVPTALTLALTALAAGSSRADTFRPAEYAMLPPYCKYTQSLGAHYPPGQLDKQEGERYTSIIGPTMHHLHHYCIGLLETNRATLSINSGLTRRTLLHSAVSNYDYVIERAPPGFVLLPEILTKKGENLFRLGRVGDATASLQRAIEAKPDYWPPYAVFSDYFRDLGDFGKAKEWLDKALAIDPNAKPLKSRRDKLATEKNRHLKQRLPHEQSEEANKASPATSSATSREDKTGPPAQ